MIARSLKTPSHGLPAIEDHPDGAGYTTHGEPLWQWFLVLTKPSGENIAKSNLERQGYRVYHARLSHPVLHRGRWMDRIVSLFPRYLFVQFNARSQSLAPVRSTLGVASIVRFGLETAVVPDAIVAALIDRADPTTGLHRLNCPRAFEPGSAVRIVGGVFEGLQGIFERDIPNDRVVILLGLLGQQTAVHVPGRFVASDTNA